MGTRTCNTCSTKCYLLTLTCLYDGLSYLHSGLDQKKVKGAMDKAQLNWVKPVIKSACFAELCEVIADFEDNNVAIPDIWDDMLSNLTELVRSATEYEYLRRGSAIVTKEGVQLPEIKNWPEFVAQLRAEVTEQQAIFIEWLADNEATYDCYPAPTCESPKAEAETFLSSWGTVSPNPPVKRNPPYQTGFDGLLR